MQRDFQLMFRIAMKIHEGGAFQRNWGITDRSDLEIQDALRLLLEAELITLDKRSSLGPFIYALTNRGHDWIDDEIARGRAEEDDRSRSERKYGFPH